MVEKRNLGLAWKEVDETVERKERRWERGDTGLERALRRKAKEPEESVIADGLLSL